MIFQCCGVELDTERFSITRDGQPVAVTPKAFDLLVFLIRERHRLVTRDQLMDEVWSGRLISDGALSNEIKLARAVVGDNGVQQKYIKTIRGRGYRFVGDVIEIRPSVEPRSTGIVDAPTLDSPGPGSIAVLPFENRSTQHEDSYFTDGFHDELITQISKIKDLTTISRTSVMAYRHGGKSIRAIGRELNATNIIEGGVQRSGDQIRINVQLIDAVRDEHIWADTYTRKLSAENVFAIQSEIAMSVAANLQAALSPQEEQHLTRTPTQNMAALDAYFRGRVSYGLATCEGFSAAIEYFRQAIRLDRDFAAAHAQLAMALLEKVHFGGLDVAVQNALAEPVIARALALNPELSEAYEALGFLERHRGNFEAAEAAYQAAIELNPNNTSALRMFGYFKSWDCEQPEQALKYFHKARLLDPQNHHTLSLMGQALMDLERFDESQTVIRAAIGSAPNAVPPYQMLGQLHSWKRYRHDEAIKAYQRAFHLDPRVPWTTFFLAVAYEELGVVDRAVHFFEWYLQLASEKAFSPIVRLRLHRIRGEHEGVQRLLEEMTEGQVIIEPWHDLLCLDGFDPRYGHPELSVRLLETVYPILTQTDLDIGADSNLFKLAIVYATLLYLIGDVGKATPISDRILEMLPPKSRYGWRGIGLMDAWLYLAMGNDDKAMTVLHQWRAGGGCRDLSRSPMVSSTVSDRTDFRALSKQISDQLAEQRANLARMDAAGDLAPVSGLPVL